MKLFCSALMVLMYLSASSAFSIGITKDNSGELVRKTDNWRFESSKCRVIHFNTCREYNVIIDRVEVNTISGKNVTGKLLYGGVEDFFIGVQVCGDGQTTYETTIWGHIRGPKKVPGLVIRRIIDVDRVFLMFDQWWPCDRSVSVY